MFFGPGEYDSGTATTQPPAAGQAVAQPEMTPQSLLQRVGALQTQLATVHGAQDLVHRRNVLVARSDELGSQLAAMGPGFDPVALLGPERELLLLEQATATLLANAGGGVPAQGQGGGLYYDTRPVRSYRLWWIFGGLALAGLAAFAVASMAKGGRKGLGSLHASKAGGGGALKDAAPAL